MTTFAANTTRFGTVEFEAADVVTFPHGLIGFSDLQQFILIRHNETQYRWLQSVDNGSIAFLTVDPAEVSATYNPEMPGWAAVELGLEEDTPRLVYTIVTIPRGRPHDMTVNLAGPIIINAETGKGVQVVLESEAYSIRQRVFPEQSESAA